MAAVALDFFSPFFRAAIIANPKDRAGSRWPLWVFGSEQESKQRSQSQAANGLGALAFCTDITVKLTQAYIPVITATLNPPIQDARLLLDSPLIEYAKGAEGSSILEVQFGYTSGPDGGALSPPFEGSLISPPSVSFGSDASITLTAQGTGGHDAARAEVGAIFEKKTRLEMIELSLKDIGIGVDRTEVTASDPEGKALDEQIDVSFPANDTPWFFVVRTAIECGCWVTLTLDGDSKPVVKITAVNKILSQAPALTFRFFDFFDGRIDAKSGVFPILGISTPTQSIFVAGASTGLRTMSYDSKTREIKAEVVNDASVAPKRTADGTVDNGSPDSNTTTSSKTFFPENTADPAQKEAVAKEFQQAQGTQGVQIEVETVGVPTLVPGAFIAVAGVSKRIDQNYIVQEVTHSIGTGGYTTKFLAMANVSPLAGGSPANRLGTAIKAPANPNTQTRNEKEPQATSPSTITIVPKGEK